VNWPALHAARAHNRSRRVPFRIANQLVGSVARLHLPALAAWPEALLLTAGGVTLAVPAEARDATLAAINAELRAQGLVLGWRDELYAIKGLHTGETLARTERAAARFWGSITYGAHANGYVADARGRPTHLWVATRSLHKPTDPGLFDNLVGGGVPSHQTPQETLVREGYEEAGLSETQMQAATAGRVMRLLRDIPEGLQLEHLHAFDLLLPADLQPQNQDGEVQRFDCLPVGEALALAATERMTVDAALVTLDFALRHQLLPPPEARALGARMEKLFVTGDLGNQKP